MDLLKELDELNLGTDERAEVLGIQGWSTRGTEGDEDDEEFGDEENPWEAPYGMTIEELEESVLLNLNWIKPEARRKLFFALEKMADRKGWVCQHPDDLRSMDIEDEENVERNQLLHAQDIFCDKNGRKNHRITRPMYLGIHPDDGEDPDWMEKKEYQKRQYLEEDYNEPWEARSGNGGKRNKVFENGNEDLDPEDMSSDCAYELGEYGLLTKPFHYTPMKKEEAPDPEAVKVQIKVRVYLVLNDDLTEKSRHATNPGGRLVKEHTEPVEAWVPLKMTTLLNDKPILRNVPEKAQIVKACLQEALKRTTNKKVVVRPEREVRSFYKTIQLPSFWSFWRGEFQENYDLLDQNFKKLSVPLAAVPDIKDRETRQEVLDQVRFDVDAGDVVIRGIGITSWELPEVRLAWKVPLEWKVASPALVYLSFSLSAQQGAKNWRTREVVNNLINLHNHRVKFGRSVPFPELDSLEERSRKLRAIWHSGKANGVVNIANLIMSNNGLDQKPEVKTGTKYTDFDHLVLNLRKVEPDTKIPCRICGKLISKARIQLACDLGINFNDPEDTLLHTCTRRVWDGRKQKVVFCDGSDIKHQSVGR